MLFMLQEDKKRGRIKVEMGTKLNPTSKIYLSAS